MEPTAIAAALARRFEGLHLTPYLCPAGVPTIGYGATYYEDGTPVTLKDPAITRERAEELLLWMIKIVYLPAVVKLFPSVENLSPGLVAALIDFAFNLGPAALRNSTLRRKIIAGLMDEVPAEFMKWVKAGGKTLRGLVLRREADVRTIEAFP
jgi:lysozyme